MSEVKRYDISAFGGMSMDECTDGAYVNYDDYAELEAKCAALAAENAGLKSAIPQLRDIDADNDNMDDVSLAEDFGFNHAIELMMRRISETQDTDAFLAEVRAQGMEMFGQYHNFSEKLFIQKEAQKFAAQLRKVGEQK